MAAVLHLCEGVAGNVGCSPHEGQLRVRLDQPQLLDLVTGTVHRWEQGEGRAREEGGRDERERETSTNLSHC